MQGTGTDPQAMSHIQTMIDLASANSSPKLSSPETPSSISSTDESIHSALKAPVGEAASIFERDHPADVLAPPKEALYKAQAWPDEALAYMPFVANKPKESATRLTPRTFAMLTIGSRGDVQPYIALALRLKKDGHKVVIITHDEFKSWVEGYGIIHRQAGGDPTALMKLSQQHAVSQITSSPQYLS
jgi:sterol 3beta-glucosyltransferase